MTNLREELERVGQHVRGFVFEHDSQAAQAWEATQFASDRVREVSVWRISPQPVPNDPRYIVMCGESEEHVNAAAAVVAEQPGASTWSVPAEAAEAIRSRRRRVALEGMAQGATEIEQVDRYGAKGARVDWGGGVHPRGDAL